MNNFSQLPTLESSSHYTVAAKAIAFIAANVRQQPSLEAIAAQVHLSPHHFQRIFSEWAGISPKRFLQVVTLEQGKHLLLDKKSVLQTSDAIGLSSNSRLYDHFVTLEAVTPGEFKNRGDSLSIQWSVETSRFGDVFVATTPRGICRLAFVDQPNQIDEEVQILTNAWPHAGITRSERGFQSTIASLFNPGKQPQKPLSLHVAGSNFQVAVWKALLRIPPGTLISYSHLARDLGKPKSARAVGNAVGQNPIGFVIPCHRVIQQSGALGGYRWGLERKEAMQFWESLHRNSVKM